MDSHLVWHMDSASIFNMKQSMANCLDGEANFAETAAIHTDLRRRWNCARLGEMETDQHGYVKTEALKLIRNWRRASEGMMRPC